jgi:hypothetical protein
MEAGAFSGVNRFCFFITSIQNVLMKTFEELKNEIKIKRSAGGECEFGTMYFEPDAPSDRDVIIRHLDNKLTIDMLPVYVHLYHSIQQWIEIHPEVNSYVFMANLIEIGKDYYTRPFYEYHVSNRRYFDTYEPIEPPDGYEEMVQVVSKELGPASENEGVISKVLRKSLLEPTGKTFYTSRKKKFIIVEPKVTIADIEQWKREHFPG